MEENKIKLVLWAGNAPNHRALANKLHASFQLTALVIDKGVAATGGGWKKLPAKIFDRLFFIRLYDAWRSVQQKYTKLYPSWPDVPTLVVNGINSNETRSFTDQFQPDLIIVSGTGLVKGELLELQSKKGIVNLHTGLSPYVKGGPNCTNWCISEGKFGCVGNTIMWLDKGIDSGNLITTELVDVRNEPDLRAAHFKVMEAAHDLYSRAVRYLLSNEPPYNSVPQSTLGKGKLYYTRMWKFKAKWRLIRNWRNRRSFPLTDQVITIKLPNE